VPQEAAAAMQHQLAAEDESAPCVPEVLPSLQCHVAYW